MGIYLAPVLIEMNYEVFVTTRKKKESTLPNLNYIIGNAHDRKFLEILFKSNWDVVVDFMLYSTEEFQLKNDFLLSNTKHYIFLSSYRVYADSNSPIIESSPKLLDCSKDIKYLKTDEYALSKTRQERILQNSDFRNWTIVRPSITYSKNRLQFATLEADSFLHRAMLRIPIVVSEDILKKWTTMTWAGDVAKMIALICNNPNSFQEDYNVVTNEAVLWSDVGRIYSKYADLDIREIDHLSYLNLAGNKYQIQYDRMYNRVMDNSKILKLTGLYQKELKRLEEGLSLEIKNTVDSSKNSLSVNYSIQGRMDGILKTRIPLSNASGIEKLKYYWNYLKFKRSDRNS